MIELAECQHLPKSSSPLSAFAPHPESKNWNIASNIHKIHRKTTIRSLRRALDEMKILNPKKWLLNKSKDKKAVVKCTGKSKSDKSDERTREASTVSGPCKQSKKDIGCQNTVERKEKHLPETPKANNAATRQKLATKEIQHLNSKIHSPNDNDVVKTCYPVENNAPAKQTRQVQQIVSIPLQKTVVEEFKDDTTCSSDYVPVPAEISTGNCSKSVYRDDITLESGDIFDEVENTKSLFSSDDCSLPEGIIRPPNSLSRRALLDPERELKILRKLAEDNANIINAEKSVWFACW